jgi:predicted NodU family carbamoyl transferase
MDHGRVIAHLELERYTRRKHDNRLPSLLHALIQERVISLPDAFDLVVVNDCRVSGFASDCGRYGFRCRPPGALVCDLIPRVSPVRRSSRRRAGRELPVPARARARRQRLALLRSLSGPLPVAQLWRDKAPGIVHVDATARPQILNAPDSNPFAYAVLRALWDDRRIPCLINTSFNVAGQPSVHTPADALNSASCMGLDALILEDRVVRLVQW